MIDLDAMEEALAAGLDAVGMDVLRKGAPELLAMARVVEALPNCSACDSAPATNVIITELSGHFFGCDDHRSPGSEDLSWADEIRALGATPFAPYVYPPKIALMEKRRKVFRDAADRAHREGLTSESFAAFMDTVAPGWRPGAAPAVPVDAPVLPTPGGPVLSAGAVAHAPRQAVSGANLALDAYAASWFAETSAADRCPILLSVEVLAVLVAGYAIPGVEHVAGRRAPEAVLRAVEAASLARPRPLAPAALALLREHEVLLAHFGGLDGYLDVVEASATVTWALRAIEALLVLARSNHLPPEVQT